jgi:hypothetical protein
MRPALLATHSKEAYEAIADAYDENIDCEFIW